MTQLAPHLPHYVRVDEPYYLLEEEGFVFSHPLSLEDFVAQLERSMELLEDAHSDVLFDRCPVDMLAYILCHPEADAFDFETWLPNIRAAIGNLDLVVFLQLDTEDTHRSAADEDGDESRLRVDETLRELLVEDSLHLDLRVLSVSGDVRARAAAVLRVLEERSSP